MTDDNTSSRDTTSNSGAASKQPCVEIVEPHEQNRSKEYSTGGRDQALDHPRGRGLQGWPTPSCVTCLIVVTLIIIATVVPILNQFEDPEKFDADNDGDEFPSWCQDDDFEDYWHNHPGYGDYGPVDYCGTSHSGLIARGSSNACGYPLRSMRVDALVVGEIAQVIITQEFQTIPMRVYPVVTEYQLPLDEQAAVTEFRAEIDTRVIQGIVKGKEQAREEFDQAVGDGLNAYLGEQVRPDIFHISIGNLPPGKIVRVTIAYVAPMKSLGTSLMQFFLPTEVAPRFDPWHNSQDPIPIGQNVFNDGVAISLTVLSRTPLFRIFSDTHQLEISQNDNFATVRVVDADPLERDLVVSFETLVPSTDPAVYLEESSDHGLAMMVSLVTEFHNDTLLSAASEGIQLEFVFIVDRSGSMAGQKMDQLKKALIYILTTLLPDDALFNVISFGTRYEALFPVSRSKESNLALALARVRSFNANLGGTDILLPLQFVLSQTVNPEENRQRVVFVVTDGEVSNTDDVIEYVEASRGTSTRVFGLGVGDHASRNLVQGIARAGDGTADFVDGDSDEAIWNAVERQMEVALTPTLDDIKVEWIFSSREGSYGEIEVPIRPFVEQAPYHAPPLLSNRRFVMYFLVDAGSINISPVLMTLSARIVGQESQLVSFEVTPDNFVPAPLGSLLIHKMAAREFIRDLEEGRSRLHDEAYNSPTILEEHVRAEIVRLGVEYQIASSETSFVAIDYDDSYIYDREGDANGDEAEMDDVYGYGYAETDDSSATEWLNGAAFLHGVLFLDIVLCVSFVLCIW